MKINLHTIYIHPVAFFPLTKRLRTVKDAFLHYEFLFACHSVRLCFPLFYPTTTITGAARCRWRSVPVRMQPEAHKLCVVLSDANKHEKFNLCKRFGFICRPGPGMYPVRRKCKQDAGAALIRPAFVLVRVLLGLVKIRPKQEGQIAAMIEANHKTKYNSLVQCPLLPDFGGHAMHFVRCLRYRTLLRVQQRWE